ncbi:MAG: hypothetical protein U1E62_22075 [Alsobacter sp.]
MASLDVRHLFEDDGRNGVPADLQVHDPVTRHRGAACLTHGERRANLPVLALAALFTGAFATSSLADVTVDQMSCSAAIQMTRQTGAYSKRTGFGIVAIRPNYTVSRAGLASCPPRFDLSFFVERTLDNPQCVVGYACVERVRLRF